MNKVVVGIPVYNGSDYIRDALESLQKQTFLDFSVLISDNCSTDDTRKICAEFVNNDYRFNYIRHDYNLGAEDNFKYILNQVNSEYFMFLGHDDSLSDNFLEVCINYLDNNADTSIVSGVPLYYSENNLKHIGVTHNHCQKYAGLRVMGYYHKVKDNGIFYGLMRMTMVNKKKYSGKFAGDHYWIADILSKGKSRIVRECNVCRQIGRGSSEHGSSISTSLIFNQANSYLSQVYSRSVKMFNKRTIGFFSLIGVLVIVISRMYFKRFLGIKQFQIRKWIRSKI
jgi:glycosyltransferase involved in cell wall biosynthesis